MQCHAMQSVMPRVHHSCASACCCHAAPELLSCPLCCSQCIPEGPAGGGVRRSPGGRERHAQR